MIKIREKAFAKLNISLDIVRKLPDGYHEMKMVMIAVSLFDDIDIKVNDEGIYRAQSNLHFLPNDERNISLRAARHFFDKAEIKGKGAEIKLHKRIPVCAGMGGGSSDAAAVLRGLNKAYGSPFGIGDLMDFGAELGSDVPFCIAGGTMLAGGRGDELCELPQFPDCCIVICKPAFSISTPKLFARVDVGKLRHHPDTDGIVDAIEKGELQGVCRRMYNVFEDVLPKRFAEIGHIKKKLLDHGSIGTAMSGAGSAVFGIFDDEHKARRAKQSLLRDYEEVVIARPIRKLKID